MQKKKKTDPKPVESYSHSSNKRVNLPTEQTEEFMPDSDRASVRYTPPVRQERSAPRLSWHRGEALDNLQLEAHPLYIHEKIHPANFIETLRESGKPTLWEEFNSLPENSTYEWYQHKGNWQNRIIRGDSSRIMASLLAKEGMGGKVQMVYFDPPYGISFKSNFQASTRSRDVGSGSKDIPNDLPTITAFRDTYENGIHSYLDNIYKNSVLARDLLSEQGNFFLQIGAANVHRLAVMLDEIFGSENRIATIPFAKTGVSSSSKLPSVADYLLWYAKDKEQSKYHQFYELLSREEKLKYLSSYSSVEESDGTCRPLTSEEEKDLSKLPNGARLYGRSQLTSTGKSTTGRSDDYTWNGKRYRCYSDRQWSVSREGLDNLARLGRLDAAGKSDVLCWKRYEQEIPGRRINNLWSQQMSATDMHYVVETAESTIKRCILMSTDPGDLVLDITCGSGTTAYVAEKWGRRWITTDTSGTAVSLARQRITTGLFDFYLLSDSKEGAAKEANLPGVSSEKNAGNANYRQDISKGFVYERVPTVSAGILAYDKQAEPTYLVNSPCKKPGTIRVASPFTVESESPYRYIAPEEIGSENEYPEGQINAIKSTLEATGINSKDNRLRFKEITEWIDEPESRAYITHLGIIDSQAENDETAGRRAAIAIAPDDMTVSPTYINKLAEGAVRIPDNINMLVVIAFAFEASVRSKPFEQRGRLEIIKAQANLDLLIGNLRDNEKDSAFVMIGEPDIHIEKVAPDLLRIEVLGYDTYNPAISNVTAGGPKDIACWMLDSDYDGNSFYARYIHFPNQSNDKQIKRLEAKLAKSLNKEAWESMLSYKSIPFKKPQSGRIAVRIITTTHTEMTTVIDCPS